MSLSDNDNHRKEGWVLYRRKKFTQGFIDCWVGDLGDDPNCITEKSFKLNSSTRYYRLNGQGIWYNENCFLFGFKNTFLYDRLYFTAIEIWNTYFSGIVD